MGLKTRFASIVGEAYVKDGLAERFVYSMDMTENPPRQPAMVVMPSTVDEVQDIIKLANETLTPLIPFVTGQNVGGLTIPQVDGAVIVDLKRMDKILEVDEEAMYMVVEPGVTFGHVRKYLDENHPDLVYTYPMAPPYTSVLANVLLQGLCDLSTARGSMADFINGLEAVIPTGELIRAGSGILGEGNWFGKYPLPDLVGLFSGWQGMTGIVTKVAIQLFRRMPFVRHAALFTFGETATTDLILRMGRADVSDDIDCHSIPLVKMLIGVEYPVEAFKGEPDYGTLITLSGNSLDEVDAKYAVLEMIVAEEKEKDPRQLLVSWKAVKKLMGDGADAWLDFPSNAFAVLTEFDGLTWVGTYIHPKNWGAALSGGKKIVDKYGFELQAFLKPMNGMHFAEYKYIIRFPKDEETLARVRKCNEELLDFALNLGALPYKTPVWATEKVMKRVDPGFLVLLKKVKEALDPNGIFNPGRWGL
ncbi:MAG: FAD-binding oxidoreductase [Candidatus Thorarchaeota archaeon]|jgi:glycolate oxidase